MNAILSHVWGQSPAQDRIWAQVAGMRPASAVRLQIMALQAFMDESENAPHGDFVLAGHIAPAENWASFSKEWERLLPMATLAEDGTYQFKMREMASSPERMARVSAFYWLIEKYVTASLSCRISLDDFQTAYERINETCDRLNVTVDWGDWQNPYFFTFRTLMDGFHQKRDDFAKIIPLSEQVDFYFDDRAEKRVIFAAWDEYIESTSKDVRKFYGAHPRFEDDRRFLPLQAADLWAWWVRRWYEEDASDFPDKMRDFDFGEWQGNYRRMIAISLNEQQIFDRLRSVLLESSKVAINREGQRFF